MKKVVFVCLGNICRSPMAEFVMKDTVGGDEFHIESRATSGWEHGNPVHSGTQTVLRKNGHVCDPQKHSQQITSDDLEFFDVVIGMDEQNVRDLQGMSQGQYDHKIYLFGETGVPDPWYTGDFDETYRLVRQGCQEWYERLK
ncbi:low molecular weight protein-tyrosine-phosphatase [Streptococcus caprae]|uniref:protein-tyrosine-phosphatase n=1 Tax=Streptococcus caprae TaxID=1640501 RepID=A0ABV8CT04_9STRE